jgi:hypothetical protein
MGHNLAADLASNPDLTLERSLSYHLTGNHYPPVPLSMVDPCIAAINAAKAREWGKLIDLPAGIKWRGKNQAPVSALIEGHHLECFIDRGDED